MNRRRATAAVMLAAMLISQGAQAKGRPRGGAGASRAAAADAAAASPLIQAGLDHMQRQEFSAAIAAFTKACRAHGESGCYFLLGYSYYQRGFLGGDPDKADKQDALETVNAYATALALDPKLAALRQPYKLYHSLALSYEALGSYDKAVDAYRGALQAAPHNPMLPLYAARLRYRMSDVGKSLSNFEMALAKAKSQGQAAALVKVVETDPKFSMMLGNQAHLDVLRRYDPSAEAPAYALASAPAQPAGDAYGLRDSVRGTAPSENRQAALRQQDKEVLDALASANDQFKFRRYRQAIAGFNEALALNRNSGVLNPTETALILERIGTSYNKLGQSQEAIGSLRRCVQAAPLNAAAHYQLALAYSVSGRYQDSLRALNEAFKTAPSTGEMKRYMLMAKTDSELEPVRDLPAFRASIDEHRQAALGQFR